MKAWKYKSIRKGLMKSWNKADNIKRTCVKKLKVGKKVITEPLGRTKKWEYKNKRIEKTKKMKKGRRT